ncbi:unnamed protein product [Sphagnum jensenii]|uniref:Uncharacterized protein n=1 Tax=Sphagnum jensenii TaxID=128206 RepID=A0ABP1A8U5_9BRYO
MSPGEGAAGRLPGTDSLGPARLQILSSSRVRKSTHMRRLHHDDSLPVSHRLHLPTLANEQAAKTRRSGDSLPETRGRPTLHD